MTAPESTLSIEDVVDDLVGYWHDTPELGEVELHQFLGMTEDEYREWATRPSQVPRLHGYWRWLHLRIRTTP